MYVVVSKWQFDPSREAEILEKGARMMATINGWPEVQSAYNIRAGEDYVIAVIAYASQEAYQKLIQDPDGPFEKAVREHSIEDGMTWIWSERGLVEANS